MTIMPDFYHKITCYILILSAYYLDLISIQKKFKLTCATHVSFKVSSENLDGDHARFVQ